MNNESAGRHLCMDDVDKNDMHVWLESGYGGCWTLVWDKDGAQRDGIAAKVPASFLGYGTYSVVMAGKFVNGDSFRTKRQLFIRLVDREDQADAEPTMYNEEQAYWAGPAVLSEMLSRDGLNTYELWILQGNEGSLEDYLSVSGLTLNDFMVQWNHLSVEVQSKIDRAEQTSINPRGDYDEEVEYHANDLVYDSETLSSYVSLLSHNTGNPVTDTTYWMKVLDGDDINQIKQDAEDEIDDALKDARTATTNAVSATTAAEAVVAQKVADAQIGYYECNTAAGTATKATTTNTIGQSTFAVPVKGCIVKVKMANANTATDTVYLQFGSDANTKKELKYNGLAVDASNSWEDGEVISVYYDGTYYQASNAQGGGSAVGKKKLTPIPGYIENYDASLGSIHTASADRTNYRYIKYPANEGDVVQISGTGVSAARLWGIVGEEDVMLDAAAANLSASDLVLVMPEGTTFITLNSKTTANPEWYYAKAGSVGAHEILTEQYIYNNIRQLTTGKTYYLNEQVRTPDRRILSMTTPIKPMNVFDIVSIGDLKIYGNSTYKAQKDVNIYDWQKEANSEYSDGDYAIGRPTTYAIVIDDSGLTVEEATNISVTIGEVTNIIELTSESTAITIAASIAAAFTNIENWELVDNLDGTLTLRSHDVDNKTISIVSNVGDTGLVITPTKTKGNIILAKYVEGVWSDVAIADYAADSGEEAMWSSALTYTDLLVYTEQAYIPKLYDSFGRNTDGGINQSTLYEYSTFKGESDLGEAGSFTRIINASGEWTDSRTGHSFRALHVFPGEKYRIKANATQTSYFAWLTSLGVSGGPYYAPGYNNRFSVSANQEAEFIVPEGTVYLYICNTNNGTLQIPQSVIKIDDLKDTVAKNKEDINDIFYNKIHAEESINIATYPSKPYCIAQGTHKWSVTGAVASDKRNHFVIPVGTFDYFKITASASARTVYAWLKTDNYSSEGSVDWASGEIHEHQISAGTTELTTRRPVDANYLYITRQNEYNYTPAAVWGCPPTSEAISDLSDRLSALEGHTEFTLPYAGEKVDLRTYHYIIATWIDSSVDSGKFIQQHQSGACFGDYYFMFKDNYAKIFIYNLRTKKHLYTIDGISGKSAERYHCNQCTFGTIYHTSGDPFPLLYVTANNDSEGRCAQDVFRITAEYDSIAGEYISFTLTQVQTIKLPIMTEDNCLGNANMAIDTFRNKMVFYSRDNDARSPNHWCKISEMDIPALGEDGEVITLEDSNILTSYFINSGAALMQGGTIYADKLFIARGYESAGYITLVVVDLIGKRQIAELPLLKNGFNKEPEGVFFYDGILRISTNNSNFYNIQFE